MSFFVAVSALARHNSMCRLASVSHVRTHRIGLDILAVDGAHCFMM
jgi:hypothetical protein